MTAIKQVTKWRKKHGLLIVTHKMGRTHKTRLSEKRKSCIMRHSHVTAAAVARWPQPVPQARAVSPGGF